MKPLEPPISKHRLQAIKKEKFSTRILFFLAGFVTGSWATLVPFVKSNTGINEATLGALLLCLGGGALFSMLLTGVLVGIYGCRRVITVSAVCLSLLVAILPTISQLILVVITLILFGVFLGLTDCAMNIQAVIVEKSLGKRSMSNFHGFYSIGNIFGAVAMSLMLLVGIPAIFAASIITIVSLVLLYFGYGGLIVYADAPKGPWIVIPKGVVLLIGLICFAVFLSEGAVLDWSAVFFIEHHGMPNSQAGIGFAAFSGMMTIGRLFGDKIISRLGPSRVIFLGAILACFGFGLAVLTASLPLAILGIALVGIGSSNVVPVMFSAIGKQTVMPEGLAVPAVSTLAYLGVLAGPALIGFVAFHSSLSTALLMVGVLLFIVAFMTRFIRV